MARRFQANWDEIKASARLSDDTCAEVEIRLVNGEVEYGDASWKLSASACGREIDQELLDVIGWSVLVWHKLDQLGQLQLSARLTEIQYIRDQIKQIIGAHTIT